MPDARGDVLCPTCGRWTPPAPYCNECGAALQGGFRDPVGAEGSDVFRRGSEVTDPGSPGSGTERFEPEPEDQAARAAAAAAGAAGVPRIDNLSEMEVAAAEPSWPTQPGSTGKQPPPAEEPVAEAPSVDATDVAAAAVVAAAVTPPKRRSRAKAAPPPEEPAAETSAESPPEPEPTPPAPEPEPIAPPPAQPPKASPPVAPPPVMAVPPPPVAPGTPTVTAGDGDDSNGGVTGLVFVLFLGLGILALLGGAIIGGVFEGGPSATASSSPTVAVATPTPQETPSTTGVASTSAVPTTSPAPTEAQPSAFPDGFIARGEICLEQPTDSTCDNNGTSNHGSFWILVSFRHGIPTDVIGVSIFDSGGDLVDGATLDLGFCGSSTDCAGYTYFHFQNFDPGDYDVKVFRNGALAAVSGFTVE